ncbi:MAG: preprotein translocase subunit YajC [Lachnospiraceae bacterium]|nr:preprotein translocase subunit YajC [Lachnospiraceae bacterium]
MLSMLLGQSAQQPTGGQSAIFWIVYILFFGVIMYFLLIRPQKKQQKQMDSVRNSVLPGDNIMTTGGFYGVVLDVVDDTVIVEFGNNKNCRIPMHKNAIAEVEKDSEEETDSKKK